LPDASELLKNRSMAYRLEYVVVKIHVMRAALVERKVVVSTGDPQVFPSALRNSSTVPGFCPSPS
jgi:hypothetical protein